MKNKKSITILIMILAAVFIFTACGAAENAEDKMDKDNMTEASELESGVAEKTEDPENPTPLAASNKTRNPEEIFRFETTALNGEGGETINPNGMLLNVGCEDCQDIFYASRSLTVDEVIEKVKMEFEYDEMIFDENFVRFDMAIDLVRKLEIDLDLIAAKKLETGEEIVNIRIISIKPDDNE